MKNIRREKLRYGIVVFLILSAACFFTESPMQAKDTAEYIAMYAYLPPLYPLFLRLLRILFGDAAFMYAAVFIQTIFAAWIVVCLSELLCDTFQTKRFIKFIIYMFLVLTYFKVDEHHPGCNLWILTEGLSYSLFYVFVYYSIIFLKEKTGMAFAKLSAATAALMLCRTQFIVCFGMLVLYVVYLLLKKEVQIKKAFYLAAGIVSGLIMVYAVQAGYEKAADKTNVNMFNLLSVGTHFYYYATAEDASRIEDESERQLFLDICEEVVENGYSYKGKEETWQEGVSSYHDSFSAIRGVVSSRITEYVQQMGIQDELMADEIAAQILNRQMKAMYPRFWQWTWDALKQFPVSMISMAAFYPGEGRWRALRGLFMAYSAVVYSLYIAVNIALFVKKKRMQIENVFCLFLMVFTVVNIAATEMMIRVIVRYFTYSFGLFYISGLLALLALFRNRDEVRVGT